MVTDTALVRADANSVLRTWRIGRRVLSAYLSVAAVALCWLAVSGPRVQGLASGAAGLGGCLVAGIVGACTAWSDGRLARWRPAQVSGPRRKAWPYRRYRTGTVVFGAFLAAVVVLGFLVQGKSDLVRATGRTTAVVDACAGGRSIVCQVHWIVDGRMYVGKIPETYYWPDPGSTVKIRYDPHHPSVIADVPGTVSLTLLLLMMVTLSAITSMSWVLREREPYLSAVARIARGY